MANHPAAKRFIVAITLGAASGLLCIFLAAQGQPQLASFSHPIAWAIFTDRILIGMVVAFAGAYTVHPILGFAYRPWLRGSCMGAVVSLPIAAGALGGPTPESMSAWTIFTATVLVGTLYGAVI
ncbi:MAG TPA: hypothetical protein HPQ00_08550, partial [Magnetococcales bacterium]|nr:hypothetical protein [Magnetococcales bacterium]